MEVTLVLGFLIFLGITSLLLGVYEVAKVVTGFQWEKSVGMWFGALLLTFFSPLVLYFSHQTLLLGTGGSLGNIEAYFVSCIVCIVAFGTALSMYIHRNRLMPLP